MGPTHLAVCELMAASLQAPDRPDPVYVNLLFKKSDPTKNATALITLIESGRLRVRSVTSRFIGPEFRSLLGPDVRIDLRKPRARNAINRRQQIRFALKVGAHLAFRALRRPLPSRRVVRAWVDTTHAVYPEAVENGSLYIYPFTGNALRQLRFFRRCRDRGWLYSSMGLPYRLGDSVWVLLRPGRRDAIILEAEIRAYRKHAQDFLDWGVEHVLTTDDFEPASCELHGKLIERGVTCLNASHGVGVYGPHVRYSHFRFLNPEQKAFYEQRGLFEKHSYWRLPEGAAERPPRSGPYRPLVVYLQGNWRQSRRRYESEFEERLVFAAREACRDLGLDFAVKVHPNVRFWNLARLRRRGIRLIRSLGEIGPSDPIFLNLLSTAYYTYLYDGPTVFVCDDLLQPWKLFGDGILFQRIEDLESELGRFREETHYKSRYEEQIQLERRRTRGEAAEA